MSITARSFFGFEHFSSAGLGDPDSCNVDSPKHLISKLLASRPIAPGSITMLSEGGSCGVLVRAAKQWYEGLRVLILEFW